MTLRDALNHFAPSLIEYLDLKPRDWRKVEKRLDERYAILKERLKTDCDPVVTKTSIYDLMLEAYLGNVTAARFLLFIDSIASGLARKIPVHLQPSVRKQARNLFLDFSKDAPKYLEKVGELAAILYILEKSGAKPLGFEVRIPERNTTFDLLVELEAGPPLAIEILNVWINDQKVTDESGLHNILNCRVARKMTEKTGVDLPASELPFSLLLILWFQDVDTVRRFAKSIIGRARGKELPACVILQYLNEQNQKAWLFSSLAELDSKGLFPPPPAAA